MEPSDPDPTGVTVKLATKVKRGPDSWNYIYVTLGFLLAIESTIIPMITPLTFPWNVIVYFTVGAITVYLFLYSGPFQNKLFAIKNAYEGKWH